jgi:hypothetical protein
MEKVKVEIIESERGWGSKVDEVKYFEASTVEEATKLAKDFCNKYNEKNNEVTYFVALR